MGQERGLAHRLPDRDTRHRGAGARCGNLYEPALFRSRAARHRLRLRDRTGLAAIMLRISDLTLARGTTRLLHGASLTVHPGHKVGLIGANGSGKSSLFALLRGEIAQEAGDVSMPPSWVIAYVAQE